MIIIYVTYIFEFKNKVSVQVFITADLFAVRVFQNAIFCNKSIKMKQKIKYQPAYIFSFIKLTIIINHAAAQKHLC